MSQISRKWLEDDIINNDKLDNSSAFTVHGLTTTDTLYVAADSTTDGTAIFNGPVITNADFTSAGDLSVLGELFVNSDATIIGKLHARSNVIADEDVLFQKDASVVGDLFVDGDATVGGTVLFGDSSILNDLYVGGKIGVGTDNPSEKIEIYNGNLTLTNSASPSIFFNPTGATNDATISTNSAGRLDISTNAGTILSVLASGSVGIGTVNPGSNKLQVQGTALITGDVLGTDQVSNLGGSSNRFAALYLDSTVYHSKRLDFSPGNVSITTAGRLGVGTDGPSATVEVAGNFLSNDATFNGPVKANLGLTVLGGASVSGGLIVDSINASGNITTSTGTIQAANLTITSNIGANTGTFSGLLQANANLNVSGSSPALNVTNGIQSDTGIFSGLITANGGLTSSQPVQVNSTLTATGVINGQAGFTTNATYGGNCTFSGLSGSVSGSWAASTLSVGNDATVTNKLLVGLSGRIGIGTTDPASYDPSANKLVVYTGAGNTGMTIATAATAQGNIFFADGVSGAAAYKGNISYDHALDKMWFGTDASTHITIVSAGQVGIGITDPDTFMNLADDVVITGTSGNAGMTLFSGGSGLGTIDFKDTDISKSNLGPGWIAYQHSVDATSNTLAFGVNEADRMVIRGAQSTGNVGSVGINLDDPHTFHHFADDLVVTGDVGNAGMTLFSGDTNLGVLNFADTINHSASSDDTLGPGWIAYDHGVNQMRIGVKDNDLISIDSSGEGIHLNDASSFHPFANALVIAGSDGNNAGLTLFSGGSNFGTLNFADTSNHSPSSPDALGPGWIVYDHANNEMRFGVENADALVIETASPAKVGIGVTNLSSFSSFAQRLVVGDGTGHEGITVYSGTSSYGSVFFADGKTAPENSRGQIAYHHGQERMEIAAGGISHMFLLANGRLGLGTEDPQVTFETLVSETGAGSTAYAAAPLQMRNDSSNTNTRCFLVAKQAKSGGGDTTAFFGADEYNHAVITVNSGDATAGVSVDAASRVGIQGDPDTVAAFKINNLSSSAGTSLVHVGGAVYFQSSDVRLKEEISTISEALSTTVKLRGVRFKWKDHPELGMQIGLIAQEVENHCPELVYENPDKFKGLRYAELTGLLVEAIKELKTENNNLRQRVTALES